MEKFTSVERYTKLPTQQAIVAHALGLVQSLYVHVEAGGTVQLVDKHGDKKPLKLL